MSFSQEVKEEITRQEYNDKCQKALLAAIIKLLASVHFSSEGMYLSIKSKNASLIKMVTTFIRNLYSANCQLIAIKQPRFDQTNIYQIDIKEKVNEILVDLDLSRDGFLCDYPRMKFFTTDASIKAYIAGCFLSTGSINSPSTPRYHCEVSTNSQIHANFICNMINKYDIESKVVLRRDRYVVYIKQAEQISNFLRVLSANNALMSFEDERIERDFVANISRLNNIDIANESKIMEANNKQIEAINFLIKTNRLKRLPQKDIDIAMLRIDYPEYSLIEIADIYQQMSGVELTKSGVRHRFNKIVDFANQYMSELTTKLKI